MAFSSSFTERLAQLERAAKARCIQSTREATQHAQRAAKVKAFTRWNTTEAARVRLPYAD